MDSVACHYQYDNLEESYRASVVLLQRSTSSSSSSSPSPSGKLGVFPRTRRSTDSAAMPPPPSRNKTHQLVYSVAWSDRELQRSSSVGAWARRSGKAFFHSRTSSFSSSDEPDFGLKLKYPMKKANTGPANGLKGLSPLNGHLPVTQKERVRHTSNSSSSHTSEDPEMSLTEETTATCTTSNFFDFDENADDIYLAQPDEHVQRLRKEEKSRRSAMKRDSITAQPFTPINVETIGGAYVQDDERNLAKIKEEGRAASPLSSLPISFQAGKPKPASPVSVHPSTPTTKDILDRDARIQELERQLEELKAARWKGPPIPDTINRILIGQSYCLEWYKSLDQKTALLDAAIDTYDGNCITTVLVFIRKTLKHHILMNMMARRPRAVSHYCSFLKQLHAWEELTAVYQTLGDNVSLGYLRLRECESMKDAEQRMRHLQNCQIVFKTTPALEKDARYIEEYHALTKKQKEIEAKESHGRARISVGVLFQPLTTTLLYCCRQHYSAPEDHVSSPEALRKAFFISEKQYFQVCLFAFCITKKWDAVESLLTTKGVFGIGKKKKSPIGFERVVRTLAHPQHRAPPEVLEKYLLLVEDIEVRLSLATYAQAFDVGIQTLKEMKDRDRLGAYVNQIPVRRQGEFRGKISALLNNKQIKWKT